jgi:hypothetical protein
MIGLPKNVSCDRAIRAFGICGYVVDHKTSRHVVMVHLTDVQRRLTIPRAHALKRGLLRRLNEHAGVSAKVFKQLV